MHGLIAVAESAGTERRVANLSDLPFQKGIPRILNVKQMF